MTMQIVGMLDSPFVRRVAVSASMMGLAFEHRSISILRQMDQFRSISPLLKVPVLVCDDGEVLNDSNLILDYLETLVGLDKRLLPSHPTSRRRAAQLIGIALIACEKTVQHLYETQLRPADKQYEPWLARVRAQLEDAWALLEPAAAAASPWLLGATLTQADVTLAVAWRFNQYAQPGLSDAARYPALAALSAKAETLPEFIAYPVDKQ
ncbi:glutathione S-transferase family protein [Uliginosibacterium sp. H3]|uniref:Glutathione S-transferase family protein n=1 Tax=Uliginosibacterium silvisoli TaxID=3114758 RepID=A0ABU6JZL5_9RHOO|nr:glutathione S-transferase family protein [Uliginosibacterium sp. H3]